MKIPYQLDFVVSDVPIDVYLPSQYFSFPDSNPSFKFIEKSW